MKKILLTLPLLLAVHSHGATLLSDNFDSGAISNDWSRKAGVTVGSGGQGGTSNYVSLNPTGSDTNGMGDVIGGANNFIIDFYFRVKDDATNRQFNMNVSTYAVNPTPSQATVNLRYQGGIGGTFAIYTSDWNSISLGSVTAGQWYHMQMEGIGWGAAGASYTLRLSDAGGTTFTKELTGLNLVQGGSIAGPFSTTNPVANYPGTAQSFVFSTVYGSNPGFDIDNVLVTGTVIPEPSAAFLAFAGLPLLAMRRRAR